jgi:hypothetical protein
MSYFSSADFETSLGVFLHSFGSPISLTTPRTAITDHFEAKLRQFMTSRAEQVLSSKAQRQALFA